MLPENKKKTREKCVRKTILIELEIEIKRRVFEIFLQSSTNLILNSVHRIKTTRAPTLSIMFSFVPPFFRLDLIRPKSSTIKPNEPITTNQLHFKQPQ